MALDASRLESAMQPSIKSAIEGFFGAPQNPAKLDEFCTALAQSISSTVVAEIVGHAEVLPAPSLTSPSGAVTGIGSVQ